MHLLLYRYLKEAQSVDMGHPSVKPASELAAVMEDEVERTRAVLRALQAHDELAQFESDLRILATEGVAPALPAVRRLIADTLLELSPDGYSLGGSPFEGSPGRTVELSPEQMVNEMVELSSLKLAAPAPEAAVDSPAKIPV